MGTQVSYGYDGRSRIKHIDSPQIGAIIADQTYTAAGLRTSTTFGNGVQTTRAYDPRLRPQEITTVPLPPHNGPAFLAYRYRYDGVSNVLSITDRRPTAIQAQRFDNSQLFTYDDLYRLTGAIYDTGRLSLTYDRIGNLTERRFVAAPGAPAGPSTPGRIRHGGPAGASNRIGRSAKAPGPQAPSSDETGRTYTYDANGNLTQLDDMTLTWDFKDRLVTVESPVARAEYVYDYAGRRVVKRVFQGPAPQRGPSVETHYISRYFEVTDGKAQRYVFDDETRLARASQSGDLLFYHHDLVASTDTLSDTSGAMIQSNAFFPFGDVRARYARNPSVRAAVPNYLFAQKERDHETGLSYFEARYLNHGLGRFASVDPVIVNLPFETLKNPQRLNGYSYSLNRPLVYQDPTGKVANLLLGGAASVALGYILAKATGSDYDWSNAAIDFGAGAVGIGIVNKLGKLRHVHKSTKLVRSFRQRAKMSMEIAEEHRHHVEALKFDNLEQYRKAAEKFVRKSPKGSVFYFRGHNENYIIFHKAKRLFAVTDKDGAIQTFFKTKPPYVKKMVEKGIIKEVK